MNSVCRRLVRLLSKVARSILQLFTGKTVEELEAPPTEPLEEQRPRKWWEFPVRLIRTSRGGPNMPKYQLCPQCRAGSKRQSKTLGGAYYFCVNHGKFFVRAAK